MNESPYAAKVSVHGARVVAPFLLRGEILRAEAILAVASSIVFGSPKHPIEEIEVCNSDLHDWISLREYRGGPSDRPIGFRNRFTWTAAVELRKASHDDLGQSVPLPPFAGNS